MSSANEAADAKPFGRDAGGEGSASDEPPGGSGQSGAEASPADQEGSASDEPHGGSGRSGAEASPADQEGSASDEVKSRTGGGEASAADDEPAIKNDSDAMAEAVELDVQELLNERDSYKDIALRLQADFENFKKRVVAQRTDEVDRATGRLAEALLPVLDAAEAAFIQHPAEVEPLFNLLLGELRKQGLEAMNLHEQPFDPAFADAVLHEPGEDDDEEPIVSEVLRTGYTWKGKVLRPAMVKVRG